MPFTYLKKACAIAAAAVWLMAMPTALWAQELSGSYLFNGLDPATGPYGGSLDIDRANDALSVHWLPDGKAASEGYALQLDNVIGGIMAPPGEGLGIVLYRVTGGRLEGIWNGFGNYTGSHGREDLSGPTGLNGTYAITLGLNNNLTRYSGSVTIRKTDQTYQVDWATPNPSYVGTGIMIGNIFVVGYGSRERPRVWAYCVAGPIFDGLSATGEDHVVAPEIIWPIEADVPGDAAARLARIKASGGVDCGGQPIAMLSQTAR